MKLAAAALAFLSLAAVAAPGVSSAAEVAGAWRVSGKVAPLSFTLNCRFTQEGSKLGGNAPTLPPATPR